MIDKEKFYEVVTQLFTNFNQIQITTGKYSESSRKILSAMNKKCRDNDLRNLKCLYKLWHDKEVQNEVKRRLEANVLDLNVDGGEVDEGSSHQNEIQISAPHDHQIENMEFTETNGADENEQIACNRCGKRTVELEIPLNDHSEEGYCYYFTLMRGDLKIQQDDTVYVLRDIPIASDPTSRKHTYKTIGQIEYTECDIFSVERLWKDQEGNSFIYGHHYLRPEETFHEPTRKFYQNEIVKVPAYEVLPIDLVMRRCWVLDPLTFCKGRPIDCDESHLYICEWRVDKKARVFTKISKKRQYPIDTNANVFKEFAEKLKIVRSYLPHDTSIVSKKDKNKKTKKI